MSLFICLKSFLVLSVRKDILNIIKLHRIPVIEDNLKWTSCLENQAIDIRNSEQEWEYIATGTRDRIGKGIEVSFKGRKKKDAINDHILLRNRA